MSESGFWRTVATLITNTYEALLNSATAPRHRQGLGLFAACFDALFTVLLVSDMVLSLFPAAVPTGLVGLACPTLSTS